MRVLIVDIARRGSEASAGLTSPIRPGLAVLSGGSV